MVQVTSHLIQSWRDSPNVVRDSWVYHRVLVPTTGALVMPCLIHLLKSSMVLRLLTTRTAIWM